jgi:enamine deaminase RidA (YjgF/YER057c/UK114 family)
MIVEQKLADLGLTFPAANQNQRGNFVGAVQGDNLLFVSGATGISEHELHGKVGRYLSVDQGYEAAKWAILASLATIKQTLGDLDRVDRVIKLLGFINAAEGFEDTPLVLNGASDLLVKLYGEQGRHARSAIGVAALPRNAPVEIEMIVSVK